LRAEAGIAGVSGCNLDDQFTLGIDLMIRGLDSGSGEPGSWHPP
jgi:hypothetical protein